MPDAKGKLSDEDQAKVKAWWDRNWVNPVTCPVCKTTGWTTEGYALEGHAYGTEPAGITFPKVTVRCDKCSHTLYFNATIMGLYPPKGDGDG